MTSCTCVNGYSFGIWLGWLVMLQLEFGVTWSWRAQHLFPKAKKEFGVFIRPLPQKGNLVSECLCLHFIDKIYTPSRTSRLQADWSVSKKVAGWIWNCCHVSAWSHWAGELWWNVILFIIVYCLSSEDGFICFVVSFKCDVRKATWKSVRSFGYCVSSPGRRSRPLVAVSPLLLRSLVGTRLGKRVLLSCQWAEPVSKSQIACNRCNKYVQTQNHWFPHRQRPISGTWVPSLVQMLTSQCRLHRNHPTYRIILLSCEICEASCGNLCLDELPPLRCWNNTNNTRWRSPRHIASAGNFQIDSRPQTVQGKLMHLNACDTTTTLLDLGNEWTDWETNDGRQMERDYSTTGGHTLTKNWGPQPYVSM